MIVRHQIIAIFSRCVRLISLLAFRSRRRGYVGKILAGTLHTEVVGRRLSPGREVKNGNSGQIHPLTRTSALDGLAKCYCALHATKGGAALQDQGPYLAAWRRYRRWSRAFWIGFGSYLPGLAFASRAVRWRRNGDGTAIFLAAFVWMIIWVVIGYRKSNFRCPRCGELFFNKFDDRPWRMVWRHNPFARRCIHCGLPKWAAQDPNPHAAA
ncbi:MAG: hypothetical protein DMG32_22915 [Acidobacteria bacterium]|nr:MAG: hypothetical protein DMG32_22915 [Acidobacteriota bacterium]